MKYNLNGMRLKSYGVVAWTYSKNNPVYIVLLTVIVAVGIEVFHPKQLFLNSLFRWARSNTGTASLILTISLIFAYLLQFQTSMKQQRLMKQQKDIMNAGYTPLVGVTDHSVEPWESFSGPPSERLVLSLTNRGNSVAKGLQVKFDIVYEGNQQYASYSKPLRRLNEHNQGRNFEGGVISHTEETVKFQAYAEVWNTKTGSPVDITAAVADIFDNKIGKIDSQHGLKPRSKISDQNKDDSQRLVRIEISIIYYNAKDEENILPVQIYDIKPRISDKQEGLYNAQKRSPFVLGDNPMSEASITE